MTYKELVNYFTEDGYEVLGEEVGMIFFKKGELVQGASIESAMSYYERR